MKKFVKLLPSFVLLVISAVLLSTSTFAWFSMNNKVTVTGMEVKTKVGSNMYIAANTTDKSIAAETAWKGAYNAEIDETTLEPVSTVDGLNYFYTVQAQKTGAATRSYSRYDETDTAAFEQAYGVEDILAYVDYEFQIKAVNTSSEAQYINLSELKLIYIGTPNNNVTNSYKAFRVAFFYEKLETANGVTPTVSFTNTSAQTELAIVAGTGAANQTANQAVSGETLADLAAVSYDGFTGIEVTAEKTAYIQVLVRLWIEGEDKACNSDTFVNLTENWVLDLGFAMETTSKSVTAVDNTAIDLSSAEVGTVTVTVNDITYTALKNVTFAGKDLYIKDSSLSSTSSVYMLDPDGTTYIITDITNICKLPE